MNASAEPTEPLAIYLACLSPQHAFPQVPFVPIQAGAALREPSAGGQTILRDDTGDNISARNGAFCELTAIYWVWKNAQLPERVGFFHYRRFFDFNSAAERNLNAEGFSTIMRISGATIRDYGFDAATIEDVLRDTDVVTSQPVDVRLKGFASVRHQYLGSPHHHRSHLRILENIFAGLDVSSRQALHQVLAGPTLAPNNMFIMRRAVFRRYCAWLFPILFELDKRIDTSALSPQGGRAVGYLAERLLDVFLMKLGLEDEALNIRRLRRVLVRDPTVLPVGLPAPDTTDFAKDSSSDRDKSLTFTLVASCDTHYVAHLAALIASVFTYAQPSRRLEFVVLYSGLTRHELRMLSRLTRLHPRATVEFLNIGDAFKSLSVHSYFTHTTFYRLAIPSLLPDHERVLFLDTDLVVLDDVTSLESIDLNGAAWAAAEDFVMRSFVRTQVKSGPEVGEVPAHRYLETRLAMPPHGEGYRQAGVLLLDLHRLRASGAFDEMIEDLGRHRYWFLDQDVINKHLWRNAASLPLRWNFVHLLPKVEAGLGVEDRVRYRDAEADPAILHYAGPHKPWKNSLNPHGHHYWENLRRTGWYEQVLRDYMQIGQRRKLLAMRDNVTPSHLRQASRLVWRALPNGVRRILQPGVAWFNRHVWKSG